MENNFYVGIVHHNKMFSKDSYNEKLVLYSNDNHNYLDLINDIEYTTDKKNKDYVLEETLEKVNISDFREDYNYLLSRHYNKPKSKKKHWHIQKDK